MIPVSRYIGIPFVDGGRDPAIGLDCWGLVRHVLKQECGIELPSLSYKSALTPAVVAPVVLDRSPEWRHEWRQVDAPQEGDIIVFRLLGYPSHVALYIGQNADFLHTEPGKAAVIESIRSPLWCRVIDSIWRHASK